MINNDYISVKKCPVLCCREAGLVDMSNYVQGLDRLLLRSNLNRGEFVECAFLL